MATQPFDFIRPGDLVFDIGALDGKYTERYLAAGARVIAVEPQPGRADNLRARFEGMPLTVIAVALGATPGKANLYLTAQPWLATLNPEKWKLARFAGYEWSNSIEVEVTTLDALIKAYGEPVFIKIDVEGHEAEVLRGLSTPVAALSFEFIGEYLDDVEMCGKRLLTLGDYEFAISYCDNNAPRAFTNLRRTLEELHSSRINLLWGDIYARRINHG